MLSLEMAKVTSKGQITIPVSIRRRLNINEGDKLLFIDSPDGVIMVNPDMLPAARGAEKLESVAEYRERAAAPAQVAAMRGDSSADGAGTGDQATETATSKGAAATANAGAPGVDTGSAVTSAGTQSTSARSTSTPSSSAPTTGTPTTGAPRADAPGAVSSGAGASSIDILGSTAQIATGTTAPAPAAPTERRESKVHGFDLNTLLDEIRSIGSKI